MKNRFLRTFPQLLFGSWFAYKLWKSSEGNFIFDVFIFLFIGIVGIAFFIRTVSKDFKEYISTQNLLSFLPTFTGSIIIAILLVINFNLNAKKNEPTLLRAFYDGGYNGFLIDFKQNGNYIMSNGSGLGEDFFYGTYSISDSIITLDKSNIDNVIKTNKIVIRKERYFLVNDSIQNTEIEKANYLTQIDDKGNEIEKDFRFRVTDDNRKQIQ